MVGGPTSLVEGMHHEQDVRSSTTNEVVAGKVPCEKGALSSTVGEVSTEKSKVVPPLVGEAVGGGESL